MTMTGSDAFQAILTHHRRLGDGVARRAGALRVVAGAGAGWEPAAAALVAYLAEEVLPHAAAEEENIYQAAVAHAELKQPVAKLVGEHRLLADAAERLAKTGSAEEAGSLGDSISSLFSTHIQKEEEVVLPLLGADPNVDLAALVQQMHHLTGAEATGDGAGTGGPAGVDVVADLTSLLLGAASDLADAGEGERACRLAAQTWAVLRGPHPQLAVRVTARLHHLVRSVTAEPVPFRSGSRQTGPAGGDGTGGDGTGGADIELDVRSLAPAQRHEQIFASYAGLAPGTAFVLVNDHDPKPLRYQFEAEHAGEFSWEPLEEGPTVWRVRIGRPAAVTSGR